VEPAGRRWPLLQCEKDTTGSVPMLRWEPIFSSPYPGVLITR
jgi:hypothetical protein